MKAVLRALLMALVVVRAVALQAHELPPEVQLYFKVDGSTLQVLARLPLATLADASLSLTPVGGLDLVESRSKLAAAAADFLRTADLMDDGVSIAPGTPGNIDWRVANPDNMAFLSYEIADAYLRSAPLPEGAVVDPARGFLDLRVAYPLRSGSPRLEARLNTLRIGGLFVPTRATYITSGGDVRQLFVRGAPARVAFEPSPAAAAARFAGLGISRIALELGLLLFLFVLAVPRRSPRDVILLLAATLVAYALAAVAVLYSPAIGPRAIGLAALAAAAMLAVGALQNFLIVRPTWVAVVAVLLGAACGVGAGAFVQEMISFAGSYGFIGATVFLAAVVAGCAMAFAVFQMAVGLFGRLPLAPRTSAVLLSLIPLHTALHAIGVEGQKLAESTGSGHLWTVTLEYWPPLVAVAGVAVLAALRALARGTPMEHPEAG